MGAIGTTSPPRPPDARLGRWGWAGLVLLLVMAAFMVFAVVSDLLADAARGIPVDHDSTFTTLTGTGWDQARAATPGTPRT